ncbi:hypothetical protein AAGS61_01685 [Lysinibacillus sp. KU-BSD001]|uniref:hypothetical protein n=1 Tax=Lysinibacillus sp. KU-BSD001 TaxID=3141328 RepID=UPI0036EA5B06
MLNISHLITLLLIFSLSVLVGGIIRVAYNSDKEINMFIRLKSLFVLQIILPIITPIYLKKNRYNVINTIENDKHLSEERKERLLSILKDDERFYRIVHYSRYGYILHFKTFLDKNIEGLNLYRRQNGKELNVGVKFTFTGLTNPFVINNLMKQPDFFENIYKEGN